MPKNSREAMQTITNLSGSPLISYRYAQYSQCPLPINHIKMPIINFFFEHVKNGKTKGNKQIYHIKYWDVHTLLNVTNTNVVMNKAKCKFLYAMHDTMIIYA